MAPPATLALLLVCLGTAPTLISGLRILGLFPFHSKSHFVMCEAVMKGLAAKGHRVDVYSHFPQSEPVPNYTDFSLEGTLEVLVNNFTHDNVVNNKALAGFLMNESTEWIRSMCKLLDHPHFEKLLNNPPQDPPYDLVILEFALPICFVPFGRRLNVPMIGIVTVATLDDIQHPLGSPQNLATDPSVFSEYSAPMSFTERLQNFITFHVARVTNEFLGVAQNNECIRKVFGPDCPGSPEILKDFSLILINQNKAINGIRAFTPAIVPVGGLHIVEKNETLPQDVQKWLDDSEHGCVYFSFGSMVKLETFPRPLIQQLYGAFANIAPTRVLLRVVDRELLPDGIPSNVMIKPWLQQMQILKHKNVKVFVTHGGLMSTQEAIHYEVPMIGIPLFIDQHMNIDAYVKLKIAVRINKNEISEESLTSALREVLGNPTYKESIRRIGRKFRDNLANPVDTAVYWVEYVHRHGKDALRSLLVDMPWWQIYLLDVYGVIVAAIILCVLILYKFYLVLAVSCRSLYHKLILKDKKNN
ncbi:UDP-glucuronosyltransferase 2B15-like [Copidosoma floridanum]|uniref:UDP-glucuronosyltransferase 2B15-like n=1 Tax=Copidosoma floridanum TaxID=29053 RepID=UPI0006C9E137|nr:UDP-glucuronosyltransferase 2B15-like [Copidosoma floridanum]